MKNNESAESENATATIEPTMLIDANVAARICSMHRATWYKAVSSGKAPAGIRIGGMVRWRRDEIESWIIAGCPARTKWEAIWNDTNKRTRDSRLIHG